LILLFVAAVFFGVERSTEYLMGQNAVALSSAMVVVFALFGAAWFSRCLLVSAESSAEGFDLAPPLPNPLAVEEIFAAFLGLVSVLFWSFAPIVIVHMLGVRETWVIYVAVGLGAAYVPMGILGQAVRGELTGTLPARVLPAIFAGIHRYLPAAMLTAAAGFLVLVGRDGTLRRMPDFVPWVADVVAGWLLYAAVHRAGVVHREEHAVRALLPTPAPMHTTEDCTTPHRPMSDIERALLEREKDNPTRTPGL
jgi:hypothetical protein